jgi:hypothetical protein
LAKNGRKDSTFIDDPQRCEICGTTLTLYPRDFAPCPHCNHKICRQCWGPVWGSKAFTAENCAHIAENDGRTMASVGEARPRLDWDWPRVIFILALGGLALGIVLFLLNLFVF